MSGETNSQALFKTLSAKMIDGIFVFVNLPTNDIPTSVSPRMIFKEAEGTTLILLKEDAEALGYSYEFPCRMITLDVHSSLEAVGFIAYIATQLANKGISVNPVSGFYHDHLFVPEGRANDVLEILFNIAQEAK